MALDLLQLQPFYIYLGLAVVGLFSGIGSSVGQTITKLWIEPYISRIHKGINDWKMKEAILRCSKHGDIRHKLCLVCKELKERYD